VSTGCLCTSASTGRHPHAHPPEAWSDEANTAVNVPIDDTGLSNEELARSLGCNPDAVDGWARR
jgi:hypothetical protein